MSKDNGGQAFPAAEPGTGGMTLRDWFAGQAPVDWEMARLAAASQSWSPRPTARACGVQWPHFGMSTPTQCWRPANASHPP